MPLEFLHHALDHAQNHKPELPESPTEADMIPWRQCIDAIDLVILRLLNERARCANYIGYIKKKLGLPIYVPEREDEVLRNVLSANEGPLSNEAVRRLFERIIDETRSLERQKYQDPMPNG